MATVQNQTSLNDLLKSGEGTSGTGIFLVPDPTRGDFGAFEKVRVQKITYQDCVRRGVFCIAFKWVPRALTAESPCSTPNEPCDIGCADDNCFCINGRCQ